MVRDVGAGNAPAGRFDVRTAFDFAISLTSDVGDHDELPAEDRRWLERARAALPDRLRPADRRRAVHLGAGLIVDRPDITDAAAFVDLLEQTPAGSSPTRSSPTSCATRLAGRRSPRRSTATGRRSTRSSASWPEQQARLAVAGSSSDSDALVEEVTELLTRVAAAVPGDRAAGRDDHRARRRPCGRATARRSAPPS